MSFLRTISPVHAYRDLRRYLASRKIHELVFLVLAILVTWTIMFALANNSEVQKEYRPNIVYVEQWSANRTDAEIIAQQKIDGPKERAASGRGEEAAGRDPGRVQAPRRQAEEVRILTTADARWMGAALALSERGKGLPRPTPM